MKKAFRKFLRLVLVPAIMAFWLILPSGSLAAEAIMVSPLRVDELVRPGQVLTGSIKVTNSSDANKKLYAFLRDFKSEGEEGRAKLIVPGTEQGTFLSSWVEISNQGVDFAAGATQEFKYKISVPQNAGPGGYYGAIIFGTKAPDVKLDSQEKGAAIGVAQQAGALILLQIAGEVDETASIREFTSDKGAYGTPFNVTLATRIQNDGNVHIKPRGTIEISNMLGKKITSLRVNDKAANVLPSSIRRLDSNWQGNFGFGRYKALLALSYGTSVEQGGQGMQSLSATTYFWVFPWKILGYTGLGFLFLAGLIYFLLDNYKNRAVKKAMSEMGVNKNYPGKERGLSPVFHVGLITLLVLVVLMLITIVFLLYIA